MRAKKLKSRVEARKPASSCSPAKPVRSPGIASRTRGAAGGSGGSGGANSRTGGGGLNGEGAGAGAGGGKFATYNMEEKILVVGDGDFSFSAGLVSHRKGRGRGLTLTSYDSAQEVLKKYPKTAKSNISKAAAAGAVILHGVDATNLSKTFANKLAGEEGTFDRIIFNFPHSGSQRVHLNRELLYNFFQSASKHLKHRGQVHVTLKMRPPYSEWQVEGQAKRAGLATGDLSLLPLYYCFTTSLLLLKKQKVDSVSSVKVLHFNQKLFPGYRHVTTEADAKTFVAATEKEARLCKTFCFIARR